MASGCPHLCALGMAFPARIARCKLPPIDTIARRVLACRTARVHTFGHARMLDGAARSRILTLVFADLADSTFLKTQHGDQAVAALVTRHLTLVTQLAGAGGGRVIDWAGDGCFLSFETPTAAVEFALRLQLAHSSEPDLPGLRLGIHMGEVSESAGPGGDTAHPRVEGLAVDLAARIAGLARPAQVLMSAAVPNSARPRIDSRQFPHAIRWQLYGNYMLKGFDEPLEIREVGLEGLANFVAPAASDKAAPAPRRQSPAQGRRALGRLPSRLLPSCALCLPACCGCARRAPLRYRRQPVRHRLKARWPKPPTSAAGRRSPCCPSTICPPIRSKPSSPTGWRKI